MSSVMSNPGGNADFGNIVSELSKCIESAVESLYKYEATDPSADLKVLRGKIQQQCQDILQYLQACQAFGADIELLNDALEGDEGDKRQFLKEMAEGTQKLKTRSKELKDKSREVQQEFKRKTSVGNNSKANDALSRIHSKLELIEKFWKSEEDEARKPINEIFTQGNVSKIIQEWRGWCLLIQEAIRAISRSTDAVPVTPPKMPESTKHSFFKWLFGIFQ